MDRVEGLKRITTKQEYEDAKSRLENYLKQYKWITETKAPYEDISKVLLRCIETRKVYADEAEMQGATPEVREQNRQIELENENKILALKLQYEAIKGDTYKGNLRRNITALYVAIGDYEARNLKGRETITEPREGTNASHEAKLPLTSRSMRRFRFWLANVTGMVPGEINMDAENRKEIPLYIAKNYDLVSIVSRDDITLEHEQQALITVPEVDTSRGMFYRMIEHPVDQFIASRGIREKGIIETTVEISENGIEKVTNEHIPYEQIQGQEQEKEQSKGAKEHHVKGDKDEIGQ